MIVYAVFQDNPDVGNLWALSVRDDSVFDKKKERYTMLTVFPLQEDADKFVKIYGGLLKEMELNLT